MGRTLRVEADGGSRGNPGVAGYGALVRDEAGTVLVELAAPIGTASNNVAEYRGMLAGLEAAHRISADAEVVVAMDSQLVVEQMADGMHVHHDDVDVLTNQPTFDFHMENLRNYMCVSNEMAEPTSWGKASLTAWGAGVGMHGVPGDVSSPSRFVRVAYTNAHYPQQNDEAANVSRLFHTLGSVQMVDGMAKMGNGQFERTLFTSGYSSKTNTYYMNTYDDPAIRSYAMADYDMDSSELISVAR